MNSRRSNLTVGVISWGPKDDMSDISKAFKSPLDHRNLGYVARVCPRLELPILVLVSTPLGLLSVSSLSLKGMTLPRGSR